MYAILYMSAHTCRDDTPVIAWGGAVVGPHPLLLARDTHPHLMPCRCGVQWTGTRTHTHTCLLGAGKC